MDSLEVFNQQRARLFAIAYRILGSVADAEDMVQETFLRWQQISLASTRSCNVDVVQSPQAYLSTITTRLCINHLRSAQRKREQKVGTWLPKPFVTQQMSAPTDISELANSLSTAFLVLSEDLSPTERAVFLLHEVFDYACSEIANVLNESEANCHQIMHRVRQRLACSSPDLDGLRLQQERIVEQFLQAWIGGDLQSLLSIMAKDITLWPDGGGKVVAAFKPLHGCDKVTRFLLAIRRSKILPTFKPQLAQVNGQLSIINETNSKPQSVFTFDIVSEGYIKNIFAVLNPKKLKRIGDDYISIPNFQITDNDSRTS